MSLYYRKHGKPYEPQYEYPGRTKQSFVEECDVNKILQRAQIAGGLSHLEKHGAFYGDFANAPSDLLEAKAILDRGAEIFNDLPSEIRREFKNDPTRFFEFVNHPDNIEKLPELFPAIAKPGNYFPDVANKHVTPNEPLNRPETPAEPPTGGEEA